MSEKYNPPKVWKHNEGNGGKFAGINRPTAGARVTKELPVGVHPFQLYSLATPNGVKVTIMFEELLALGIKEAEYDAYLININDGDQFSSGFVNINPNSKIPALLDKNNGNPIHIFESASKRNDRAVFLKVNTETNQTLSGELGIRSIPCTIIYRGGKEVHRQNGAMSAEQINQLV